MPNDDSVRPTCALVAWRGPPPPVGLIPASAAVVRPGDNVHCEVLSGADHSLDVVLVHVLLLGHNFEVL
ncbi:hypothetical protein, partial [Nocardia abscessus]|uniref:hypothetical protein n=1 Tax=Nocardia abscessus TaxID=120957 RepID=UPI0024560145